MAAHAAWSRAQANRENPGSPGVRWSCPPSQRRWSPPSPVARQPTRGSATKTNPNGVLAAQQTLLTYIAWPGKPGYVPPPPPRPLTAVEQQRFAAGELVYAHTCVQCHKADGQGQEGLAPPLQNSDWVLGSEQRLRADRAQHGLRGAVERRWPHLQSRHAELASGCPMINSPRC